VISQVLQLVHCWPIHFSDVKTIRDGLADKVSLVIQNLGMTATGVILALIYSWKLALVTLTVAPLIVISSGMMIKVSE